MSPIQRIRFPLFYSRVENVLKIEMRMRSRLAEHKFFEKGATSDNQQRTEISIASVERVGVHETAMKLINREPQGVGRRQSFVFFACGDAVGCVCFMLFVHSKDNAIFLVGSLIHLCLSPCYVQMWLPWQSRHLTMC
jgi:hypothetical protein